MIRITDTSYNFTGLSHDNNYTVSVAGRNNAGVGTSTEIIVRTLQNSKRNHTNITAYAYYDVLPDVYMYGTDLMQRRTCECYPRKFTMEYSRGNLLAVRDWAKIFAS